LATTLLETDAPAATDHDAAPVALVSQGAQIELTGAAAPGFLSLYYDGQAVWVPAQYPSLGVRPGIDTGVTIAETPLLDAPMRDGSAVEIIHEGRAVILTGARVDGFGTAEYDGAGVWVDKRDRSR
jgi:hypothetical protein